MTVKTFEEIEAAIIDKEKDRENRLQVLEATKEMAAEELAKAEAEMQAADEAADRKAYEKASGNKWVAERKVAKAQRELDAFTDQNTDELIAISEDLTNLSFDYTEKAKAYCKELEKELEDKIEEYEGITAKGNALYERLGSLQGLPFNQRGRMLYLPVERLKDAKYELSH